MRVAIVDVRTAAVRSVVAETTSRGPRRVLDRTVAVGVARVLHGTHDPAAAGTVDVLRETARRFHEAHVRLGVDEVAITVDGELRNGATAKDVILAIISRIGTGGGIGHMVEYRGSVIRNLSMEGRMTICNMSIEAGARAGMIAPDDTTFDYVEGKPMAPKGALWEEALADWRTLPTDEGATFASLAQKKDQAA